MLKALTANRLFGMNQFQKTKRITKADLCAGVTELTFDQNTYMTTVELAKDESVCYTTKGTLVGFGEGLKWEGVDPDGKSIAAVENAWGGNNGTFKITGTAETTTVIFYYNERYGGNIETSAHNALYMKKDFSAKITSKMHVEISKQLFTNEAVRFIHINPLKSTATINTDDYVVVQGNLDRSPPTIEKANNLQYTGELIIVTSVPSEYGDLVSGASKVPPSDGDYASSTEISIKADSYPPNYPDQVVELKSGVIFGPNTPEYTPPELTVDDDDGDGLSGGAIAGIVIACVVVVAVVVFCIVWFVVLKKPCLCKKSES